MNYSLDEWIPDKPDFNLFHIYCHQKDYRLCGALNEQFRCKMVRVSDFLEEEKKPHLPSYAQFYWEDEVTHREFYLIANRPVAQPAIAKAGDLFPAASQELIIPELAKVDYFLQVYGQFGKKDLDEIEDHLNLIPMINAAKMVNPESSKSYLNLMH